MSDKFYIYTAIVAAVIIFFSIIRSKVKFRRVIEDFEAELYPTNANEYSQAGRGEVEREFYGDGSAELKLRFRGTNLPEGSMVTLVINGTKIDDFQVSEGRVYEKIETRSGRTVPSVKEGDTADITFEGTPILTGTFYRD